MAEGSKLQMKFETLSGLKTWNFNYANPEVEASSVKNLASKMIENGSIYQYPPLKGYSATIVITTERKIDIDDVVASQSTTDRAVNTLMNASAETGYKRPL